MTALARADSSEEATRHRQLAAVIAQWPSRAEFARTFGLSDAYLWQLQNRHAPFGERAARQLERKLNLPRQWFEQREVA